MHPPERRSESPSDLIKVFPDHQRRFLLWTYVEREPIWFHAAYIEVYVKPTADYKSAERVIARLT
jgi:hypothetical protein